MKNTLLILAVAAASTVASAGTINTGLAGPSGPVLAPSKLDGNYTMTGPGGGGPVPMTIPGLYSPAYYNTASNPNTPSIGSANADWISSTLGFSAPTGIYVFTEIWTATSTTVSGIWATDNCGSFAVSGGATVSGGTIGSIASCNGAIANYSTPVAFTISGLTPGTVYTSTITLYNNDGPVSLLVDAGSSATPEPASVLSVLTGLGLVAFGIRRRKTAK